jgi:hypothetical protein
MKNIIKTVPKVPEMVTWAYVKKHMGIYQPNDALDIRLVNVGGKTSVVLYIDADTCEAAENCWSDHKFVVTDEEMSITIG